MMEPVSRRRFVMSAATAASAGRVAGANDRIRLGVIGTGNRGKYLMRKANEAGGAEWMALCDACDARRDEAETLTGKRLDKCADYRRLVERNDIDAVIVSAWDHVHTKFRGILPGRQGRVRRKADDAAPDGRPPDCPGGAREHKRVIQVGTQQRSIPHFREAKEKFMDTGRIGRVTMVGTLWNSNLGHVTLPPPPGMESKPAGLDWDLCQDELPKVPWDPKRCFNHCVSWDYSTNAQVGGLFVHMADVVHWYLNLRAPRAGVAMGGIYLTQEGRDTADNFNAIVEYPGPVNVTFEANVTDLIRKDAENIVFMGDGGRLSIFRWGYRFLPAGHDKKGGEIAGERTPDLHVANWLDCVRSRKKANVDEVEGHYGAMACHIANIAYKEGHRVDWRFPPG